MNRLIVSFFAFLFVSPALAGAEEAHKGGLPQFNPESWPSQLFWLAISFALLYFFFAKFTIPSLGSTLQARADKIEGDLKSAESLSIRAEEIKTGYELELKKAASKASADMKQIDEEAKTKLVSSLADFRTRYEKEVAIVEQKLDGAKATAMQDMQKIAADVAAQAAEKIAGIPADSAQAQNIVNNLKNKAA